MLNGNGGGITIIAILPVVRAKSEKYQPKPFPGCFLFSISTYIWAVQ